MMAFVFLYKETGDSLHHVKIQQNSSCLQARKGTLIRNQTMISDFPASRNKVCLNKYERPFHVPRVPNLACVLASFCSFFNTQQRLPSPCSLPRPTRAQVSDLWVTPSPTTAFISLDFSQVCRQLICACLVCELCSQQLAPEHRVNSEN
ncbi:PREDICTED: uncharacterized protein LOC105601145 isoform X1 [Cercocebus atys]|uniref:uncharacterized protein LOC105601145 isoform X1 n=2 Tax=Cercocebus atys TaxID=9531 RepID=UPI0005F4D667|nr:PREDICTED: uncharacterized protein LOC105601145 isoform X1 [Cercocebus atys]